MRYKSKIAFITLFFSIVNTSINIYSEIKPKQNNQLSEVLLKYESKNKNVISNNNEKHFAKVPKSYENTINISNNYARTNFFDMEKYFENLADYSPNNSNGSCGYVSLIQVLSYYDTFYNDDIIPERFDRYDDSSKDEMSASMISPGVLRNAYSSESGKTYFEFCRDNRDIDFQSELTYEYNYENGTANNELYYNTQTKQYEPNFDASLGPWESEALLKRYYQKNNIDIDFQMSDYALGEDTNCQNDYINIIKSVIDTGNPVMVCIKKTIGNNDIRHAVVAYAYDENNIYANFGWDDTDTKLPLIGGAAKYEYIYRVNVLDFSRSKHKHSNNYYVNGSGFCGCNLIDEFRFKNAGSINTPPTIYWMKDISDSNETYELKFCNSKNSLSIRSYATSYNQITISLDDWTTIMNRCENDIYICFKRKSNKCTYEEIWHSYQNPKGISIILGSLSPSEYNFESQYYFYEKTKIIDKGLINFTTNRFRCGYIENEYIVLSSRRNNAFEAYLEFKNNYDLTLSYIEINMSFWSANEGLNWSNGKAVIQYKDENGYWVTCFDMLNDIILSVDRNIQDSYTIVFPKNYVKEFRIYSSCLFGGDRNKGRICIGNTTFCS